MNRLLHLHNFQIAPPSICPNRTPIHPFREGNGRTQRAFLEVLAERARHPVDLRRITPEIWHQASVLGFHKGNYEPMRNLILEALEKKD
jgi:cell filamentation protein